MKLNAKQYAEVLYERLKDASAAESTRIIKEFSHLLFHNCQSGLLPSIHFFFDKGMLSDKKLIRSSTVSAHGVAEVTPHKIDGMKVVDTQKTDGSLIAGVRVVIGATRIDNTLSTRLHNLRLALTQ